METDEPPAAIPVPPPANPLLALGAQLGEELKGVRKEIAAERVTRENQQSDQEKSNNRFKLILAAGLVLSLLDIGFTVWIFHSQKSTQATQHQLSGLVHQIAMDRHDQAVAQCQTTDKGREALREFITDQGKPWRDLVPNPTPQQAAFLDHLDASYAAEASKFPPIDCTKVP